MKSLEVLTPCALLGLSGSQLILVPFTPHFTAPPEIHQVPSSFDTLGPMPQIASLPSSSSTAQVPTTPVRDPAKHGREDNRFGGDIAPPPGPRDVYSFLCHCLDSAANGVVSFASTRQKV